MVSHSWFSYQKILLSLLLPPISFWRNLWSSDVVGLQLHHLWAGWDWWELECNTSSLSPTASISILRIIVFEFNGNLFTRNSDPLNLVKSPSEECLGLWDLSFQDSEIMDCSGRGGLHFGPEMSKTVNLEDIYFGTTFMIWLETKVQIIYQKVKILRWTAYW